MNIIERLRQQVINRGPVCVGLDPREGLFPEYIQNSDWTITKKLFEFNKAIIDATYEEVACYKPQIACYEAFGLEGLMAYKETLKYIKKKGQISIGDIKRGDISSTGDMYAKAHFEGDFEVDIITVNPYMGEDAISPYYKYMKDGNKGLFALVRTSNQSSVDFQELKVEGEEVFIKGAKLVEKWGEQFREKEEFSCIGGVVGLTFPEEFEKIKKAAPHTFFLIPGYGAQGGTGKDAARVLGKEMCGVINSSRGIIGAHKGKNETETFAEEALKEVKRMKEDILKWL